MKNKILKEIDSFSALLYTFGKANAAEGVKKFFTDIVNQTWDSNKDDETNLEAVKSSFNFNKALNAFHNNSDIVKCIDMFMSDYLSKV
jgi:hypothetical protein